MRKYIVMGVQGSGKGTPARMLKDDFDLVHISVGDRGKELVITADGTRDPLQVQAEIRRKRGLPPRAEPPAPSRPGAPRGR